MNSPLRIYIVKGDITNVRADAIVNAANSSLMGGGGVDGAIHRVAGPELKAACRPLAPCPPGEARITPGFHLPAKYVIHTVGPVWRGGSHKEKFILREAYLNSLKLAAANHIKTMAFPSISTGAYGFPVHLASDIAIDAIFNFLQNNTLPHEVMIICFDDITLKYYKQALEKVSDG
jgi:O-acetyl-ADP-ribose deacetylase (regulator of RNase III)